MRTRPSVPDPAARDPLAGLRDALLTTRPGADFGLIRRAYEVAAECHLGQRRMSGDAYITHPVAVATIMARLRADDQAVCAAILHDTVEDTPLTMAGLRRGFGTEIAALVAGVTALDRPWIQTTASALAAIGPAGERVAVIKIADRLHNMQTVRFLPPTKQLQKARESLTVFAPVAEELRLPAIGGELQTLALTTLIRNQPARPASPRTIVALDIERSTSRPDHVKAELRVMLYELFDAALRSAGIGPEQRDEFMDRGDGLLALLHPGGEGPAQVLLGRVIPYFARLLASYNTGPTPLRIRLAVHRGEVSYDANGCYGEALDTAFRLLNAPAAKQALATAPGPLLVVVSDEVGRAAAGRLDLGPEGRRLTVATGDIPRSGRVFCPVVLSPDGAQ